jgi:uncharacterized Ntn-hydrolase superfamily protein
VALLALATVLAAPAAQATYSLLAVDTTRGHVGIAVASCVGSFDLSVLYRTVPDVGAVQVQARLGYATREQLLPLVASGISPAAALVAVTDLAFDPRAAQRQYAIVDFAGAAAAFTGSGTGNEAADRQGRFPEGVYSVQGNLLTGIAVLDELERGFLTAEGCDLGERLWRALAAVASRPGIGDNRCTPAVSANSAFVRVDAANGTPLLLLNVQDTQAQEPVLALRPAYDAFRREHPCGSLPQTSPPCSRPQASEADSCGVQRSGVTEHGSESVLVPLMLTSLLALLARRRLNSTG